MNHSVFHYDAVNVSLKPETFPDLFKDFKQKQMFHDSERISKQCFKKMCGKPP